MSHLQVSQENAVVRDTVTRRVKAVLGKATKGEVFDVKIPEFDEVYYNIKAEKNVPHVVTISLALPKGIPLPTGAAQVVKQSYDALAADCVTVRSPSERGYDLTVECDLSKIQSQEQGALFSSKISMLRSLVQCIPLRKILTDLNQGKSTEKQATCIRYKRKRAMYVKPLVDSVVVVFPVHFEDENDATLAVNFLQHFAETKRTQQNLANSPSCAYHLNPPLEVQEGMRSDSTALSGDDKANGGYMSFSLFSRHVNTADKVDSVAWKMCTFYSFISYHIKASKGHIQSRMRTKADDWLDVLAKAKAAPPKKQPKSIRLQG